MIPADILISPVISPEMLRLVAELDEFRAQWKAFKAMTPERLTALRHSAIIESIGSSTRIEGSKLTDQQVAELLSNLATTSFESRDEQEVAGYAEVMDLIFGSWDQLSVTENHILQLHRNLLRHAAKHENHRESTKNYPTAFRLLTPGARRLEWFLKPVRRLRRPWPWTGSVAGSLRRKPTESSIRY